MEPSPGEWTASPLAIVTSDAVGVYEVNQVRVTCMWFVAPESIIHADGACGRPSGPPRTTERVVAPTVAPGGGRR